GELIGDALRHVHTLAHISSPICNRAFFGGVWIRFVVTTLLPWDSFSSGCSGYSKVASRPRRIVCLCPGELATIIVPGLPEEAVQSTALIFRNGRLALTVGGRVRGIPFESGSTNRELRLTGALERNAHHQRMLDRSSGKGCSMIAHEQSECAAKRFRHFVTKL